jgi:hypothetical protein
MTETKKFRMKSAATRVNGMRSELKRVSSSQHETPKPPGSRGATGWKVKTTNASSKTQTHLTSREPWTKERNTVHTPANEEGTSTPGKKGQCPPGADKRTDEH